MDDQEGDLVQLLKTKRFFFQKEYTGTLPKLFYILPDDESYAKQSVSHNTVIHTWDDIKPLYDAAKARRSKEWKR